MKYAITYGFRRLSACKKLGHKHVPCYIKTLNKTIDIPIEDIVILNKNTRLEEKSEEMTELMESIKQKGLLQPIGVSLQDELSEDDFLILNLVENLQRSNPTPLEISKGIQKLKRLGLNNSEIATRLSIPKTKIKSLDLLSRRITEEDMERAAFYNSGGGKRSGKIPYSVLNSISRSGIGEDNIKKLISYAQKEDLVESDISLIRSLVMGGLNLDKAIKDRDKYIMVQPKIICLKKAYNEYKLKKRFVGFIMEILTKKREIPNDLFIDLNKGELKNE